MHHDPTDPTAPIDPTAPTIDPPAPTDPPAPPPLPLDSPWTLSPPVPTWATPPSMPPALQPVLPPAPPALPPTSAVVSSSGPTANTPRRRGRTLHRAGAAALVVAVVLGSAAIGAGIGDAIRSQAGDPAATASPDTAAVATSPIPATTEAAATPSGAEVSQGAQSNVDAATVAGVVVPSVVYVEVSGAGFGGAQGQAIASGSGVVIDGDGHIVTNRHVVAAGTSYRVTLADGRTYPATLLGTDAATDLAVLEVSAADLSPIALGATDELGVGDPAVAVGSPLGLEGGPSLTVGVISALGREVQTDSQTILYGMLQTDAAITEGSSGGALVDGRGRLIGITTAVGVSSVGVEGIGFATPVEIVARVAEEIIETGAASRAGIGITGATAYTDLDDGGQMPTGVSIESVTAGSPAGAAGLESGDVITRVDGLAVDTMDELISRLRRHRAGDSVSLTVRRDGAVETVTVELASL